MVKSATVALALLISPLLAGAPLLAAEQAKTAPAAPGAQAAAGAGATANGAATAPAGAAAGASSGTSAGSTGSATAAGAATGSTSVAAGSSATAAAAAGSGGNAAVEAEPVDWENWKAGNDVADLSSLQRGARNFMNYCVGCHGLKYERYQRMATDLMIPTAALQKYLITTTATPRDYINTNMPAADSANWFGKTPPDLSLMVSARGGPDYVYRFLKTFYADPSQPTGTNNLALPNAAMPAVLSSLEGVKEAVYRDVKTTVDGKTTVEKQFDHFETVVPGTMTPAQFDGFVRDTVNFLDYVSEPAQVERRSMGIWVVLFLLLFTGFAWLLKREYWKKVH